MIVIMQISKLLFGPLGVILVVLVANGSAGAIGKQVGEQANEVVSDTSSGVNSNGDNILASANNGESQYRANYYYAPAAAGTAKLVASSTAAGNRNIVWNRDSYTDAAQDYGYNLESAQAYGVPQQQGYQAQYQASSHNTPSIFSNNGGDGKYDFLYISVKEYTKLLYMP